MATQSPSLLLRIQNSSKNGDWQVFVAIYQPILVRFARSQGMRHDDAEDIALTVLDQLRYEIAKWNFAAGLKKFQAYLRDMVLASAQKYERVRQHRQLAEGSPDLPTEPRLGAEAAFEWLWTQEHIWYCLEQLDAEITDSWEIAKAVQAELLLLNDLSEAGARNPCVPLGERRRQIEQAGPLPVHRKVDAYADPLPAGWIPGLITLAEIGRGVQGVSYLAINESTGTKVMIKVFHREYSDDPARANAIEQAIQFAQNLQHPYIVPIYGMGHCQNGQLYVAMKHLQGCTLQQALMGGYPGMPATTEMQRLKWLRQASEAVCYAHQHGLLHLGLHDRNIVIDEHKNACVVDFGLPSLADENQPADAIRDLTAICTLLQTCFVRPDDHQNDSQCLSQNQLDGLHAIIRQGLEARIGSLYQNVEQLRRDLIALENNGAVFAQSIDFSFRAKRFFRSRIGTAVVGALLIAYTVYGHQMATGGRRAKLMAAEQVHDVRGIVNEIFASLKGEAERSLTPQSSHRQLQDLARRYLQWLEKLPEPKDHLRLDIANMLLVIADAQMQNTAARQPNSPSALLTLGKVHEAIPSDLEVAKSWTELLDRAAQIRLQAWLQADEIYRRRNFELDHSRRLQCLENADALLTDERRHWFAQPTSLERRMHVELAWMRYNADGGRFLKARKHAEKFAQLHATSLKLKAATDAPNWIEPMLNEVVPNAVQGMLEAGAVEQAEIWLWQDKNLRKQLGSPISQQNLALMHQIALARGGAPRPQGEQWPSGWQFIHRLIHQAVKSYAP
ncbi:MAG: protein kinase [Planctomycetes bacterium]|nr:protein kinase [Planctomycetota bacterium]